MEVGFDKVVMDGLQEEADRKENRPLSELLGLLFAHFEKHIEFYCLFR